MKRLILIILFTLLLPAAHGADENKKDASVTKPATEQKEKPEAKKEKKISETFVPSEEISEGLSVPFPVDM